jgi:hypothetical protein
LSLFQSGSGKLVRPLFEGVGLPHRDLDCHGNALRSDASSQALECVSELSKRLLLRAC